MAEFKVTLDVGKAPSLTQTVCARVGEVGSCVIVAEIVDGGEPMSLTGYTARFECCKPDKTMVRDTKCTIAGNKITYTLNKSATAMPGLVNVAYFALLKGSDVIETTANIAIRVMPSAESAGNGMSKDYLSEIDAMLEILNAQKAAYDIAEAARASAETKRATDSSAATTAATTAAKAATSATSSASDATTSANTAKDNATKAAELANTAALGASVSKTAADEATIKANTAAQDAIVAAEEARGSISPDKKVYITYDTVGDTDYLTIIDTEA